jgi:hypothetical protein
MRFPRNRGRKKLSSNESGPPSFGLGLTKTYAQEYQVSRTTPAAPNLTKHLNKIIQREVLPTIPGFTYTSLFLNKGYAADMHVDSGNEGDSFLMGLGDYCGGELWVAASDGDHLMEVKSAMTGWPCRAGQRVRGWTHDIKEGWLVFNGKIPHAVLPFQGNRISVVAFTKTGWWDAPEDVTLKLQQEYGFSCWPTNRPNHSAAASPENVGEPEDHDDNEFYSSEEEVSDAESESGKVLAGKRPLQQLSPDANQPDAKRLSADNNGVSGTTTDSSESLHLGTNGSQFSLQQPQEDVKQEMGQSNSVIVLE